MTKRQGYFEREFDLSGGVLCLDFANTVSRRKLPGRTHDNLPEYRDLVTFAKQSRVLSAQYARELVAASSVQAREAVQVIESALVLREAIYRIFSAWADRRPVSMKDVKFIEEFAGEAMQHRTLVRVGRSYRWEWKRDKNEALEFVLWPIAQSAAELLTSEQIKKVRECAAPTCAWLFLDDSRNHSRRWCDMKVCGNRQKARRHYERHK